MNDNLTINDVYDDDVKEIYVFNKNNIPKGIIKTLGHPNKFTALAVYRYKDDTWINALLLYDQLYDDFDDTCNKIYEIFKDAICRKGIFFIRDFNDVDSKMFIPENYHIYNFV